MKTYTQYMLYLVNNHIQYLLLTERKLKAREFPKSL